MARGRKPGFRMSDEHRTKIANSKVLSGLVKFAEGELSAEEYPPHRVSAALGLLKKVMPDMAQTDVTTNGKDISMPQKIIITGADD